MSAVVMVIDYDSLTEVSKDQIRGTQYLDYVSTHLQQELHVDGLAVDFVVDLHDEMSVRMVTYQDESFDCPDLLIILENMAPRDDYQEYINELLDVVLPALALNNGSPVHIKLQQIHNTYVIVVEDVAEHVIALLMDVEAESATKH